MAKKWFFGIITILVSVAFFVLLILKLPPQLTRKGIFLTDEFLLLLMCGVIFLSFRAQGWHWKYVALVMTICIFLLPLLRLWHTGESSWNIVLGLFPWLDAGGYYWDANRLLNGALFSEFSGRRPIFASFLSILLWLTGKNLQSTLVILAFLNGIAAFLIGSQIRNLLGPLYGVIFIYLSQIFYRPFAGTTLTEQLGIPIGFVAMGCLINAVLSKKKALFFLGLLLTTFSLLIRAGTFFLLITLLLYGIYLFGRKNYPALLTHSAIFTFAILIPFFTNFLLGQAVASANSIQFGNFSSTLYGQAVGGKSWRQVFIDHAYLGNIAEPQLSQEIYRLAFDEIRQHPQHLLLGASRSIFDFVIPSSSSAFGFIKFGNQFLDISVRWLLTISFFMGIRFLWLSKSHPLYQLFLVSLTGIFFSIPFLPPIDAGMRPYAATIGILFLPVLYALPSLKKKNALDETFEATHSLTFSAIVSIILVGSVVLFSPIIRKTSQLATYQSIDCPNGQLAVDFSITRGSYVLLLSEKDRQKQTTIPFMLIKDVLKSFDDFPYGDFAKNFRSIRQSVLIAFVVEPTAGSAMWIIAPTDLAKLQGKRVSACGEVMDFENFVLQIKTFSTR